MRDVQRSQVYRGESDWTVRQAPIPCDPHAEWERIRRDPWFVQQFPWTARNVELVDVGRGTYSWACWQTQLIGIHPTMRFRQVVLHEVAHICTYERYESVTASVQAHGPEFVAMLLSLTAHFVSVDEAAGLSRALRARGVARWPGEQRRAVRVRQGRLRWDTTRAGVFTGRGPVDTVIALNGLVTHRWEYVESLAMARRIARNIAERSVEDNPGCEVRVVFTRRNGWGELEGQETWSHRSVSSVSAAA